MTLFPSRDRFKHILILALPVIGGMISQNVLNLVDIAMVGTLGAVAIAAVGMASFINFFSFSIIAGLAAGVQATAARRFGEKKYNETALPLNAGLLLSVVGGIPITLLLLYLSHDILALMMNDPAVIDEAKPYLEIRALVICLVGINFAFRGYWNAIQKAKLYMFTLLGMHSLNILLNYLLIFGNWGFPELGTRGAAIGTSVSIFLGTLTYIYLGYHHAFKAGFMRLRPSMSQLMRMITLSLPNSIQQLTFAAGLTALIWIVSQIGTHEMAVANILMNIALVAVLPAIGFGLTAASLVGKSLGEQNTQDARQWSWDVVKTGSIIFLLMMLIAFIFAEPILSIFLYDPALVAIGLLPLRLFAIAILFDGAGLIMMQALLGAGATRHVMTISFVLQWGLFLPIAWLLVNLFGLGLVAVWLAFITYRISQALFFVLYWQYGQWSKITV